ncbi:MAG: PAS domain-containing sensor histidine kinase [Oligoflexia bacterium]|nr:MAG: PAS domain-containing sensor histidine kinase [Oligoflexia bacterium]
MPSLIIQSIRVGMYLIVLALALLVHLTQDGFLNWKLYSQFYFFTGVGLFIHLIGLVFTSKALKGRYWVGFTFVADVLLISYLMIQSELNPSLFLFMYLVVIILSGLYFQKKGALLTAALSSVCYSLAAILGPEVKAMTFFFMFILTNLAFFAVAVLSGHLTEQLEIQGISLGFLRKLNELIVETIPSGLMTVTEAGDILQVNQGAKKILEQEDIVGKNLLQVIPSASQLFESVRNQRQSQKLDLTYSKGDDQTLLSTQMIPQAQGEVPTYLMVFDDQTQIRRLESAVRQAEKMAAVGQLAAGIAHEIRNPLAGISGSIELLSQQNQSEEDRKLSKIIMKEIDRLNRLISEFLDFAKPEKVPVDPVNLSSLLKEICLAVTMDPSLKQGEQILSLNEVPMIRGHRDKLKQAFLNMMINSYQAMGQVEKPVMEISCTHKDNEVIVRLKDNGCGMSEETKRRMFEPFHTTKPKGTGLGLAVTHKILENHGASLEVQSEIGQGTEIKIHFPIERK